MVSILSMDAESTPETGVGFSLIQGYSHGRAVTEIRQLGSLFLLDHHDMVVGRRLLQLQRLMGQRVQPLVDVAAIINRLVNPP
jgi:hypothetical protein